MMKNDFSQKSYSTPVLSLKRFTEQDVITSSGGDNLGGIPDGWGGVDAQGGGF